MLQVQKPGTKALLTVEVQDGNSNIFGVAKQRFKPMFPASTQCLAKMKNIKALSETVPPDYRN